MQPSLAKAIQIARTKRVLPTALSSREILEAFDLGVLDRSIFSARTTHAGYLKLLQVTMQQVLAGKDAAGNAFGIPEARLRLTYALAALGYDSEKGAFGLPEDATVPPALRGTLEDLGSRRRLNYVLEMQEAILTNAARRSSELEPDRVKQFPAWQLVRVGSVDTPRGFERGKSGALVPVPQDAWQARWEAAGGPAAGKQALIAYKWDPIWRNLGDPELYRDGLGTQHPPYAHGSKKGWREVPLSVAEPTLGKPNWPAEFTAEDRADIPPAATSLRSLPANVQAELVRDLKAHEAKNGTLTLDDILKRELARRNAA